MAPGDDERPRNKHFDIYEMPDLDGVPDTIFQYVIFKSHAFVAYDEPFDMPHDSYVQIDRPFFKNVHIPGTAPESLGTAVPVHPSAQARRRIGCAVAWPSPCQSFLIHEHYRLITGCGIKKDIRAAYRLLMPLVLHQGPERPAHISRRVQARALALLACSEHDEAFEKDPDSCNIDAALRAALFANDAAGMGLVAPVVLWLGTKLADMGLRSKEAWEANQLPQYPYNPKFAEMTYMWEACDRRSEEMDRKERRLEKKMAKNENAYRCATPGCGIIATKKAILLRCAGRCPEEAKAYYCSKECQTEDWKSHKQVCRPGKGQTKNDTTALAKPRPTRESVFDEPCDGKERSIEILNPNYPGGKMRISSTTLSAGALRSAKESIQESISKRANP